MKAIFKFWLLAAFLYLAESQKCTKSQQKNKDNIAAMTSQLEKQYSEVLKYLENFNQCSQESEAQNEVTLQISNILESFESLKDIIHTPWKFVTTTGFPNAEGIKSEVIDLEHRKNDCQNLLDHPLPVSGSTGNIIEGQSALICGGLGDRGFSKDCYLLNDSKPILSMETARGFSSSVVEGQDLIIFGGINGLGISSIERVSVKTKSSSIIGQMPFTLAYGCAAKDDKGKIILAGGLLNYAVSSTTWTTSMKDLGSWTKGPDLPVKRFGQACGIFPDLDLFVVVGGSDGVSIQKSTDFWSISTSNSYQKGPELPDGLFGPSLVNHPEDPKILFLSGGRIGFDSISEHIYHLRCLSEKSCGRWRQLGQKMSVPRYHHLSFIVFNDFNCTISE